MTEAPPAARNLRVCVFGTGAVGGHIAARLAKGGAEVSLVARGAHLAAIRGNGLTVKTPDEILRLNGPAADDARELGPQDVVVTALKSHSLPGAAGAIASLLKPDSSVVFALNGIPWWYFHRHGGALDGRRIEALDPQGDLWRLIGPERAVGCVIYSGCRQTEPGVIETSGSGRLVIGRPDGAANGLDAIAAPLRRGGMTIDVTARIRDEIWTKLVQNFSTGGLAVACGAAMSAVFAEKGCERATRALLAEGLAIAGAMDRSVALDADRFLAALSASAHRPSILQDVDQGRPLEVEAIYSQPLKFARMYGIDAPMLELMEAILSVRNRSLADRPASNG